MSYEPVTNENIQIPHWFDCTLILDKKILKDYPFYATIIWDFCLILIMLL